MQHRKKRHDWPLRTDNGWVKDMTARATPITQAAENRAKFPLIRLKVRRDLRRQALRRQRLAHRPLEPRVAERVLHLLDQYIPAKSRTRRNLQRTI